MDWNFHHASPDDHSVGQPHLQHEPRRPVIALLGATGVGKTCFASRAMGQDLQAERLMDYGPRIVEHEFRHRSLDMDVILIDAPGFDDPNKSDPVLLIEFSEYFQHLASRGLSLWGIIYFHRINDTRMYGSAQRTLQLLALMIGERYLRHVRLCTTMWNQVDRERGESREEQLKTKFWTELIDKGAQVERFDGTPRSARSIIEDLVRSVQFPDTTIHDSQFDRPGDRRALSETEEGRLALRSLDDTLQELQESLHGIQRQLTEPDFQNFGSQPDHTELFTQERVLQGQIRIVEGLKASFLNPGSPQSHGPEADVFTRSSLAQQSPDPAYSSFPMHNDPRDSWNDSAAPQLDPRALRGQRSFGGGTGSLALDPGVDFEPPFRQRGSHSPRFAGGGRGSQEHIEAGGGGGFHQLPEQPRGFDQAFVGSRNW
ncbi:hypothetical protein PV04_03107 [Phialophora macrospora]|uniref:G domain-containing protein n=1 Tax=Phialophora macrospora TaxID=1851006 RepID=A0A0D2E981_9EURO|nr:hypothetical protein PV04_03107 [Phialophora macrospora]